MNAVRRLEGGVPAPRSGPADAPPRNAAAERAIWDVLERVPESSLALRPLLWIGWFLDPGRDARRLCFLVFALAGALIYRRCGTEPLRLTGLLLAAFLAACPTVFPWYVLWLVPLWPFVPSPALLCFTLTAAVGGAVKVHELATGNERQKIPRCSRQMQGDDGPQAFERGADQQRLERIADIDDRHRHARKQELLVDQCGGSLKFLGRRTRPAEI